MIPPLFLGDRIGNFDALVECERREFFGNLQKSLVSRDETSINEVIAIF
jgi:hypothetical protein